MLLESELEMRKVLDKMGISLILFTDPDLITRAKMILYLFVFFSLFDFLHLNFFFLMFCHY